MEITQLNIYPIKSLRPISLQTATLQPNGLLHDRNYILLQLLPNGTYRNMFIGYTPSMALFHCHLSTSTTFTVSYHSPSHSPYSDPLPSTEIPYTSDLQTLKRITINLHTSRTYPAYLMPSQYTTWFSTHFTFPVHLAYIGPNPSPPNEPTISSPSTESWISSLKPQLPSPSQVENLTFSDSAALLVVSSSSLEALHSLLESSSPSAKEEGGEEKEKVILEKFRPNIVVSSPTLPAWDEDYWSSLSISSPSSPESEIKILLTSNCARCTSINVDLSTGKMGTGPAGSLLKKMMKERRVDEGNKWEPIFGRYGFPLSGGEVAIGDQVRVEGRRERSVWNGVIPRLSRFDD